jgi:16S rRNA (cytosine1402-N4)-methyltransferase
VQGCFDNLHNIIREIGVDKVDGVVFDLGVSSMQLDRGARGFSFLHEGPLDMRMSKSGISAKDFINSASEEELANVIYKYGDEYDARKIARRIVAERPISTTRELASITRSAIGFRKSKIDLATKTFQAIRIFVNDEIGTLERALNNLDTILKPNGRAVFITFHAIEDTIIKSYFKENSLKKVSVSKYHEPQHTQDDALYRLITRKAIKPNVKEILENSRSRSAKLRAAEKI